MREEEGVEMDGGDRRWAEGRTVEIEERWREEAIVGVRGGGIGRGRWGWI